MRTRPFSVTHDGAPRVGHITLLAVQVVLEIVDPFAFRKRWQEAFVGCEFLPVVVVSGSGRWVVPGC